ncbi:MAG: hypothetical protein Ct9H90mP3_8490 [Flammeovirgaceae bacterium]|nr:MAG: hypothetical protein Ct9H90mP3_8490 [Flammeovirgaceae bacterium]
MLNFFAILIIIFIVFLLLNFKKISFKNTRNLKNLYSNKLINNRNNKKYISKKNSFSYKHEYKKYSEFDKKALRHKMYQLFLGNKEDKLKALQIAKELADKSTLPILRKGLKDTSPEVVEISANLIRNFK